MVEIEINGQKLQAEQGSMIIEAADAAGITIPRFCYHKKLSIAANCRMCLVEVDKLRKPVPACATPITDGMKVYTQSPAALESQRAVMEFLLINHPLDCPICDQGGECELQDLAMGYGGDISRFNEGKRVVNDKDIGPLIATDLTRCIQCTRCVRFGEEIAGVRELGMIGRGEHAQISMYVKGTVDSELSGNIIDLCPVGALTSKPYRYTARPWELQQRPSISPHDCVGSNIYVHSRSQEVMRVVPKEKESLNETWIADRDRYSYQGLYSDDRLQKPMMKDEAGRWQTVDWETALNKVVQKITPIIEERQGNQIGGLISPNATLEEHYLLQKLLRLIGSDNIDHRLRQVDFSDDEFLPQSTVSATDMQGISSADRILIVGSHIRKEQPLVAHRIRSAQLNGAVVNEINPMDFALSFEVSMKALAPISQLPRALAGVVKTLYALRNQTAPAFLTDSLSTVVATEQEKLIAEHLNSGEKVVVCVGSLALTHHNAALLRALANELSHLVNAKIVWLYDGGNSVGAWLAGSVPHRKTGGIAVEKIGLSVTEMLRKPLRAYFLLGIEPELDTAMGHAAVLNLAKAECVVALTCYDTPTLRNCADILLPIAPFTETSGTYVNFAGEWQTVTGVVAPYGDSRPAWKVLRVMGNLLGLPSFEYDSTEQIALRIKEIVSAAQVKVKDTAELVLRLLPVKAERKVTSFERIAEVPIYSGDALVRRAIALQKTHDAQVRYVGLHPDTAQALGLAEGQLVKIFTHIDAEYAISMPVKYDERLLSDTVWIATAIPETTTLGPGYMPVTLERV